MSKTVQIVEEVKKAVVGKDDVIVQSLMAILAGGHILLEDVPGVGKTTLALAFARALALDCRRMQFTPDVLPSDITGFSIYRKETGEMEYQPGAVLCNLFLADELNRATARTQSALLEAMEEKQVTVDGVTHAVPRPFVVIATQNPTGASGTQLLPDSQMDRFMVRLSLGYPSADAELELLRRKQKSALLKNVQQVMERRELLALRKEVRTLYISDSVLRYIVELNAATREHADILQGASPRATVALAQMARASAFLRGRDYVTPADVQRVYCCTIGHRLRLAPQAEDADSLLKEILRTVSAPQIR